MPQKPPPVVEFLVFLSGIVLFWAWLYVATTLCTSLLAVTVKGGKAI